MRDDDTEYQKSDESPVPRSAAFLNAVTVQILSAQRNQDSSRPVGSRPANSSKVYYCCGDKGHLEAACRQKKAREGGPSGEASFFHGWFHGGYAAVAERKGSDSYHDHSVPLPTSRHEKFSFGE